MIESPVLRISIEEICQSVNISEDFILELVQYSIVVPVAGDAPKEWLFNPDSVSVVKKATRLHRDLAIDLADLALVLNLLSEIDVLKEENSRLKQRLNRFLMD
jgi:chaperone modulatory protein CbpM